MVHDDGFWKLEHLSDAQLLESLGGVLRSQRRALAQVVAHLGEVEDRRLHLEAAHGSMFSYCVGRLGMSEDEACRRLELARLARRFPALFTELATGRITLSVALVLKPVLSSSNQLELLAAVRGKCIRQAREFVAGRFPKPDAPSSIRQLPQRPARPSELAPASALALSSATLALPTCPELPALATNVPTPASAAEPLVAAATMPFSPTAFSSAASLPTPIVQTSPLAFSSSAGGGCNFAPPALKQEPSALLSGNGSAAVSSRSRIEPLSARRYRIQFTADADLKQKLEQARDLLRHAHPDGDFAPIIARALDLLVADLLRRRFGAGARGKAPRPESAQAGQISSTAPQAGPERQSAGEPSTVVLHSAPKRRAARVPRAVRRAVLERDGLGCSWVDAHGLRCGSQAWLELDHREPVGRGGSSEPDNVRLLCRAHNQFAAEQAYGREHIERASQRQRATQQSRQPHE